MNTEVSVIKFDMSDSDVLFDEQVIEDAQGDVNRIDEAVWVAVIAEDDLSQAEMDAGIDPEQLTYCSGLQRSSRKTAVMALDRLENELEYLLTYEMSY